MPQLDRARSTARRERAVVSHARPFGWLLAYDPFCEVTPDRGRRPLDRGDTLLVELRPILHIHLHPQTSKNLHLRFHLGRADHPERVK